LRPVAQRNRRKEERVIYFYAGTHQGKRVELSANKNHGAIGVHYDGKTVASLNPEDAKQLLTWLVNHGRIDLNEIIERKRIFDEDECMCTGVGPFAVTSKGCPQHFTG